ncbi:penicillin-binding protein 2 [Chromobacterium amazonense]|uniref:Peptidoglycan D,D-transpeptidase MrdA n=1 Tax=Chromobacterium amazonense TaxID=1382803 RepID=A0A1S1XCZ3_9NEIS|nr:penicillin-binding protein 2 [Chromobacterium amazonense]KIA81091.1 penicillin-binding protein [Chromobacterium piscinae]MDQ4540012.1 penicillin-binding protein 2 [Chromobacterium amazonense]OHX17907.1 penicillin-binding protein 2 [Chromobacterium amazonense]PRP68984.1 penicillin-binding protein 2 [Chromobacterium amazonense]
MRRPTRFKNPQNDEEQFELRLVIAYALIILMFLVLLSRFIWLQVLQHDHFSTLAQNNRISLVPILPNRGLILDRNGVVLAQNYSAYTLELTPSKMPDLDATIKKLKTLADVTPRDEKLFKKLLAESKNFESIPLKVKLTDAEAARVASHAWELPGVEVKARLFRDYPYKEMTSHVLGYIGRINQKDKERLDDEDKTTNYKGTNYIGKTGLEAVYEDDLHGQVGFEEVETDSGGRAVRTLRRTPPINGNTLKLALDIRLQEMADKLFGDRRGALVAIDPNTGGVLAFLSKPGFDPSLFIDGIDSQTWSSLNADWQKPLVNRALRGTYPPGSTFKPFMSMAALVTHSIGMHDIRPAPGYFTLPGSSHQFRDSKKGGNGMVNLQRAITVSSDTFFYKLAWDMGIDKIHPVVGSFGLGSKTGIDLDGEASGVLPSKEWKAKRFARYKPEVRRWYPADVVSVGIGQGFNSYTPLQMANATAIMANNGIAFKPHLVQQVVDSKTGQVRLIEPKPVKQLPYPQEYFDYIKEGMHNVMISGTGARVGQGLQYTMAGKTGTAQVVAIKQGAKYNAAALAEQYRDHSWFIAFAPVEKPKIAVAIIVENAGFGAAAAAPVARGLFDFYLLGKVPKDMNGLLKTIPQENGDVSEDAAD